jgi:hypothetical protein
MSGKTLKARLRGFKKEVESEGAWRDPLMTWVDERSGNVILAELLSLHVPADRPPFYQLKLLTGCNLVSWRPGARTKKSCITQGAKGDVVSLIETDDISCLRYFIDEMALKGVSYEVWIKWRAFRQEVHVREVEDGKKAEGVAVG